MWSCKLCFTKNVDAHLTMCLQYANSRRVDGVQTAVERAASELK